MIESLKREIELTDRHITILGIIYQNEPVGVVKLSDESGYDHHEIRYSLRILEENELIDPTNSGAVTTDKCNEYMGELDEKIDEQIDILKTIKFELGS